MRRWSSATSRARRFPACACACASSTRALGRDRRQPLRPARRRLTMIGVTGTNGKTTTTFLVEALARAAGGEPGVIGTVTYRYRRRGAPAPFTTPTPLELHATLAEMRAAGVTPRGDGVQLARARARAARRRALPGRGVHQPHPGPSRLSRHDGGLSRRQGEAVPRAPRAGGSAVINIDASTARYGARRRAGGRCASSATGGGADVRVIEVEHSIDGIDAGWRRRRGRSRCARRSSARSTWRTWRWRSASALGLGLDARRDRARLSAACAACRGGSSAWTAPSASSSTTRTRPTRSSG